MVLGIASCKDPVAVCQCRSIISLLLIASKVLDNSVLRFLKSQFRHLDHHTTRAYGGEELLLVFSDEDEQRFLWRLLDAFQ